MDDGSDDSSTEIDAEAGSTKIQDATELDMDEAKAFWPKLTLPPPVKATRPRR